MRITAALLEALSAYHRTPTLKEALRCIADSNIQSLALVAAMDVRDIALNMNDILTIRNEDPLQHRKFLVGGVAIGVIPILGSNRHEWFVQVAHNTKERNDGICRKKCAENRLGEAGLKAGCACFVAVAVVAESQPDGRSGRDYGTLDPCETCRDDMRGMYQPLYRSDTLVVTKNPSTRLQRVRTVSELMEDHAEGAYPPPATAFSEARVSA